MTNKVTITDFGMGNIFNLQRAVAYKGGDVVVTSDPKTVATADRLILPGVGAFPRAMDELKKRGLLEPIHDFLSTERPGLGICLGMQMLFSKSAEFGDHEGLGEIEGSVEQFRRLNYKASELKIPQVGWNTLLSPASQSDPVEWRTGLLAGLAPGVAMYFVHSFFCRPNDTNAVVAETVYGNDRFCSVVNRGNLWGCQFHPERSGAEGLGILSNFINL